MQNSPKKSSPNSKKLAAPFSYVSAFFNPVSRQELQESYKNSREVLRDAQELISESRALGQKIDQALAMK